MTKAAIIISAILVFAGVAAASSLPGLGSGSNNTPSLDTPPLASTSTGTTTGTPTTGDVRREDRRADDDDNAEDVSGPCDEAEHANDPRCTGAQGQAQNQGADDNPNHDANDDRSGPNRGSDDSSGDDNSGHGGGGDDD
jgi:hypothetical protein